jgi:hypothetical protein
MRLDQQLMKQVATGMYLQHTMMLKQALMLVLIVTVLMLMLMVKTMVVIVVVTRQMGSLPLSWTPRHLKTSTAQQQQQQQQQHCGYMCYHQQQCRMHLPDLQQQQQQSVRRCRSAPTTPTAVPLWTQRRQQRTPQPLQLSSSSSTHQRPLQQLLLFLLQRPHLPQRCGCSTSSSSQRAPLRALCLLA